MDLKLIDHVRLTNYLRDNKVIKNHQSVIKKTIAGDGNMNYTFRLSLNNGESLIIKQAPPFCAKFPQIAAPIERILVEAHFYNIGKDIDKIKSSIPDCYFVDRIFSIAVFEDLGEIPDMSCVYSGSLFSEENVKSLSTLLSQINSIKPQSPIENREMRNLNSLHIFDIPLQSENGLNLDEITHGLELRKYKLMQNKDYLATLKKMKDLYNSDGEFLLHGDYYPSSILEKNNILYIIDPEFSFTGCVEFDAGVCLAHLVLSNHPKNSGEIFLSYYKPRQGHSDEFVLAFCAIEIMRRLLGYAQLPLDLTLKSKEKYLDFSEKLLLSPTYKTFFGFYDEN